MKNKIWFWLSGLNLVLILLVYLLSFMTKNNHYALPVDTMFVVSSVVVLAISLIAKNKKAAYIGVVSVVLAICMNVFNIGIDYQKWIEREQPSIGDR